LLIIAGFFLLGLAAEAAGKKLIVCKNGYQPYKNTWFIRIFTQNAVFVGIFLDFFG